MTQIHLPKMAASMFGTLTPAEYHAVDRGRTWGGDATTPIASLMALVGTGPDRSWMADAACRGMDPNVFHPERGEKVDAALRICATCPVVEQCRAYGEATESGQHGIWGGASARTRRTDAITRRLEADGKPTTCVTEGCDRPIAYPRKRVCTRCGSREYDALRKAEGRRTSYECGICGRVFTGRAGCANHIGTGHLVTDRDEIASLITTRLGGTRVVTPINDRARRNHPAGRNL